jgi:sec-independent protein translocase protein TatC
MTVLLRSSRARSRHPVPSLPRRVERSAEVDFVGHLDELRRRVLVVGAAFAAAACAFYPVHSRLVSLLNRPLPPAHRHPLTLSVAEPFVVSIKIVLVAAGIAVLPVALWQVWAFLAPAISEPTERAIAVLVALASVLLCGGLVFGYFVALPAAVRFLTSYDTAQFDIQIRASEYYSFAVLVILAVAIVFELPVFILGLARLRIIDSRRLRRNRRMGYFIVAVIAVALPGVDPVTTTMEMVPLMLLFESSIWAVVWLEHRERRSAIEGATTGVAS